MTRRCLKRSIPAEPGSSLTARLSVAERPKESFQDEGPTEKAESQKLQARTLEGNTAPHCKQVFVTGKFCAADASTPVRRERSKNTIYLKMSSRQNRGIVTQETAGQGKIPRGRGTSFKVLDEIGRKLGKSRNQVALNWVLQHDSVVAIPKAADTDHVKENAEVAEWKLGSEDYQRLAKAFS